MRRPGLLTAIVVLLVSGCGPSGESDGKSRVEKLREAVVAKVTNSGKPAPVEPAELEFFDDLPQALAKATAERKPLLMVFAAEWCFHSRQLLSEVLPHESVRHLTEQFICVRIDVDRSPELCAEYRIRAYPTLIFATSSGAAQHRLTGAQQDDVIAQEMAATLAATAERMAMPPNAAPLQR